MLVVKFGSQKEHKIINILEEINEKYILQSKNGLNKFELSEDQSDLRKQLSQLS